MRGLRSMGAVAFLIVALVTSGRSQGSGTWTRAAPLLSSRTEVTGAELGGRLYVIGGFGQGGDQVEAYDPRADRWERRAPLPVPLHHAAAVAVGGRLYVIGGYSGGQWAVLDTMFEYDPAADRWRTRAPLPTARGALAAAVLDGRIYVAGGVGASRRNTDAFEVYDPATDRWESRAPMPVPRDHHAAGVVGGQAPRRRRSARRELCAEPRRPSRVRPRDQRLGGRPPALPTARSGIAAAVLGPRLFVFGGEAPAGTFGQVEAYDVDHEPVEHPDPDADAAPRLDGDAVRSADPRALGRPAARWVVQQRPRDPQSLSSHSRRRPSGHPRAGCGSLEPSRETPR